MQTGSEVWSDESVEWASTLGMRERAWNENWAICDKYLRRLWNWRSLKYAWAALHCCSLILNKSEWGVIHSAFQAGSLIKKALGRPPPTALYNSLCPYPSIPPVSKNPSISALYSAHNWASTVRRVKNSRFITRWVKKNQLETACPLFWDCLPA